MATQHKNGYSCAHATQHGCKCKSCSGTLHRWPGCLELALEPDDAKRAEFRNNIDAKWNKSTEKRKRKSATPTIPAKEAATDSALADIVDWLANHPAVPAQIKAIADTLGDNVVNELDSSFDAEHRDKRRLDRLNHFWCDLLARVRPCTGRVTATARPDPELHDVRDHRCKK